MTIADAPQRRRASTRAALCIVGVLALSAAPSRGATPTEPGEDAAPSAPFTDTLTVGAAGKMAAVDEALRTLEQRRGALRDELQSADASRQDEGRRARRLAREILVAELHGHAVAASPKDLVQNAAMRSGLRRVAARTLASHASRRSSVDELRASLAALDVEEARLKGERAVAEAEQRLEHESARRRRETLQSIFSGSSDADSSPSHARIRVAEAGSDDDTDTEAFASRKGTLALPIQRRCRIKSKRDETIGGAYLAISSKGGSNVRAIAGGTVVFADDLAPYGKLVVVDHGQSYFSVYGGLSRINVSNGEPMKEGLVVGAVDDDVPLIFQLRVGSRTTSGLSWFKGHGKPKVARDEQP
jgi:murein DD-endopeptidase MepM/ murein hydrolase activator NlpD